MSSITIEPELIARLRKARGPCWLCDADGNLVGYFHPGKFEPPQVYEEGDVPELSEEEVQRRLAEPGGRTWEEIKRDLERMT
jgi:hypothetical protein